MRKRLLVAAAALALAGCGEVHGTPAELVRGAAQRTLDAKTAHVVVQYEDGVRREGDVELRGDRAKIVEHGEFGYKEYRYTGDGAWYELGGKYNPYGEDLGGKWIRHPRRSERERDVLDQYDAVVRSLARATRIRALGHRLYRARLDGGAARIRLDSHGRLVRLRTPETLYELGDFGTDVDVEAPPKDEIYTGHD